jgi:ABC-type Fe3+ transport system substrate-binding protein
LFDDAGLNKEFILPEPAGYPSPIGYAQTLAYNDEILSADELPDSFLNWTDSKWSGKFGWPKYVMSNAEICYFLGLNEEESIQFIRDIIANKPARESFDALVTKLTTGELHFSVIGSHEYDRIPLADPDAPISWELTGDFLLLVEQGVIPLKGAKNANAAALMLLWYCTPEGRDYVATTGFTHYLDPGTTEYQMVKEAEKRGIPVIRTARDKDYIEWLKSPDMEDFQEKIDLALKGQ